MEAETRQRPQIYPYPRIDKSGRVGMPAELRTELGLSDGSRVHWVKDASGVRIETAEEALKALQHYFAKLVPPGVSLADELIAERREETARESRE